ncbi:hypothetical protein BJX61DRAFT_547070 [Aspergillus egyptiacus]|nr:hypothetical protein BJX61DRAFT_547070 [Aspergillus egyptiacus]
MATDTCYIDPDPDIIGIGIRISIYILSLTSPIILFFFPSSPLSSSIQTSSGVTGLALFLTMIIKTALGDFTLFHALCVLHLLGLVGMSISPKGRYAMSAFHAVAFNTLYVLATIASLIYFIFVFASAPTFGSQEECNKETLYVIFWVGVPATHNAVRWLFVACFALIVCGILLQSYATYVRHVTDQDLDSEVLSGGIDEFHLRWGAFDCMLNGGSEEEDARRRAEEIAVAKRIRMIVATIGHLVACIYLIVMLELILTRNRLRPGLQRWQFGQVLAMMMLIGPLMEVLSLVRDPGSRSRRNTSA